MPLIPMFLLLFFGALGLSGITGYLIFGPLTYRQLLDRERRIGGHAFAPEFLRYVLLGRFRPEGDRSVTGLATPAQLLAWSTIIGGLVSTFLLFAFAL